MGTEQIKTHRYPGVKPFSENERHLFYGRTTDTKKLYQLINLEKLVLLYSKSGLGKSSLLNAGVLPLFDEEEGYTTIKIRLGAYFDQSLSPIATSLFKLPQALSNPVLDKLGAGSDTLWLRMKALQHADADVPKTYILVFDQFEELFTYNQEDIKQFKKQLADLLYSKVPGYISKSVTNRLRENPEFLSGEELEFLYRQPVVKVVLSIRSDRMSLLNTLADYLPDIQKNYYELKPLDRDSAIDSIVKPAMDKSDLYLSPSFGYSGDCVNKILDYLTQSGQKTIETFQLQTVCQFTENLAIENQLHYDNKKQMLLAEPGILGDLQNIFRTQYDKLIGNIEPVEKQLAARLLIENKLIIDGNRVSLPDVVVLKEKGINKDLIAYLHDTHHILRSEPNTTGGISYELSHDTLVAPILKAKKEREDKEELARLDAERQEELRKQKEKAEKEKLELTKTRKQLRVVYGLLTLALIAIIAAVFLYFNANTQKEKVQQAYNRIIEFQKKADGKKLITIAEQEVNDDPTIALRIAEAAIEKYPDSLIVRSAAQVYANNAFYKTIIRNEPVNTIAFSPNGTEVLTGSGDNIVRLRNLNGNLLKEFKGHTGAINAVAFSPDGTKILTGSDDRTARLWNLNSNLFKEFKGHIGAINAVAFSPDGTKILTGSYDKTARLWDLNGNLIREFKGHTASISSVAFSPDGTKILTGSYDKTARLWTIDGGLLTAFKKHLGPVNSVAFSPDGTKILTAGWDKTARLWDLHGSLLQDFKGHSDLIESIAFSPDGTKIFTGSYDRTARLWELNGSLIREFKGHTDALSSVAFSTDGTKVLTSSMDKTVRLWNLNAGLLTTFKKHLNSVSSVAFSPDGTKILTGCYDRTARLWNLNGNLLKEFKGHTGAISSVAFSPDGTKILTGSYDRTARLWTIDKGLFKEFRQTDSVSSVAFSPDGTKILLGSFDSTARLWNLDGNLIREFKGHAGYVFAVAFSPDGTKILTGSQDKTARLWNLDGKLLKEFIGHSNSVSSVAFSPDGTKILTGSRDKTAGLWSLDGVLLKEFKGHTFYVSSVVFSRDGTRIVTGSWDNTARVWNLNGVLLQEFKGHSGAVRSVDVSRDGSKVVTGSEDKTAKLWSDIVTPLEVFLKNNTIDTLTEQQKIEFQVK